MANRRGSAQGNARNRGTSTRPTRVGGAPATVAVQDIVQNLSGTLRTRPDPAAMIREVANPATWQNGLAELLGTFFLTLAALLGGYPYVAGITLGIFVYAIGGISGCHINPAVTVGLLAARRLSLAAAGVYVLAQVVGAILARLFAPLVGEMPEEFAAAGGWAEFFGFGFLMLTVIAVTRGYAPAAGSGLAIGGALTAGLVVSGGILNPAVAVAMGEITSPGVWATFLSAVVFSALFVALSHLRDDAKA